MPKGRKEDPLQTAIKLRELIYGATTAKTPNFGGHHGIYGFEASIGADVLRAVDTFAGAIKHGKADPQMIEQVRAQCSLARSTNILTDSDMEKADTLLDTIEEEL